MFRLLFLPRALLLMNL
ncbi:hypothetical protein LINPERHAP1_LOCUS12096 [Linum perenne]